MIQNAAVEAALKSDHAIRAIPVVVMNWNMNRFIGAVADNTPAEDTNGYDIELFPIESILEHPRPEKGLNKARVGQGTISSPYLNAPDTANGQFYIATDDDIYKYWTSPNTSNASGVITQCKPQVIYDESVDVNKIVIGTENSWASALTFSVQVTRNAAPTDTVNATNWVEIANQTTMGTAWRAKGRMVLYYNGDGVGLTGWTTTGRADNTDGTPKLIDIRGVRIVVTALTGGYRKDGQPSTYSKPNSTGRMIEYNTDGNNSHFDLIQMAAYREEDVSRYIIDVSSDYELSEVSQLYPIGTITSNVADLTLSNLYEQSPGVWVPGLWNSDNTTSPFYQLAESNVEVSCHYVFEDEDGGSLGTVQEFVMFTDEWGDTTDDEVGINLRDQSKFLDEITVNSVLWENLTAPQIIWRLLDSIGFNNYHIDTGPDVVAEHVIPVFYTNGEKTAWEILDEIAKSTQSAIFFDKHGVLQVKTRDFAYSPTATPEWTFNAESSTGVLADIETLSRESEFAPNSFTVGYKKTRWSSRNRDQPTMQKVWEPEGSQVLRGTELVRTLALTGTTFYISASEARLWPYKGLVNIQGELIRYAGKHYVYYTGSNGGIRNGAFIDSAAELSAVNAKTPVAHRHKNHFTGGMKITERGVWNSEEKRHPVDAEGYSVRHVLNGVSRTNVPGFRYLKQESKVQLKSTKNYNDAADILVATRGAHADFPFPYYGTKMRFVKEIGKRHQCGGIVIHNQTTNEDGYYFELRPSRWITAKQRKTRKEVTLYRRKNGVSKILETRAAAIGENIEYEVDVQYTDMPDSTNQRLKMWLNGKLTIDHMVSGDDLVAPGGRFGLFTKGRTRAKFEYLYAVKSPHRDLPDDFSFFDKVRTAYWGNAWDREWVYQWRTRVVRRKKKSTREKAKWSTMFMDDFGPYVHEVREYDVKFDPAPVLHSRLYMSNDWSAAALEYSGTPFGGKFIIANTARHNAVIHGEDTRSFAGTGSSVNQVLTIFGRALVIDDEKTIKASNTDQIRIRGKIESELNADWIQSEDMAKDISDWLKSSWSHGNENFTAEVFGNPLIEVGDVVHVNYPDKHIDDDFFVYSVKNSFDQGISTSLGLRRRVN